MNIAKEKAITFRRNGLSYSEILKQIPVAKSTLSLWLRSVGLSTQQRQRLTEKKLASAYRGAQAKHQKRLQQIKRIQITAERDFDELQKDQLWLIGLLLYWGEGAKQKVHNVSQPVALINSDPRIIEFFIRWLNEVIKIPLSDITYELYIHESANIQKALEYWGRILSCDIRNFKVYLKRHQIRKIHRRNVGDEYVGQMRIKVHRSTVLNRKIAIWIDVLCKYWGIV